MIGEQLASTRTAAADTAVGKLAARKGYRYAFVSAASWSALLLYCLVVWFDWLPWIRGWEIYPLGWTSFTFPYPPLSLILPIILLIGAIWSSVRLAEAVAASARLTPALKRGVVVCFLVALAILGSGLQMAFLGVKSENALTLLVNRVTDRVFTGYFTMASYRPNIDAYFANYPAVYTTKLCPHCHDHPPGPALYYWASLQAAAALPVEWQHSLAPSLWGAMGDGEMVAKLKARLSDTQLLGATLGGGLLLLLSCLVVVPLFGLAKLLGPPGYEYRLAALGVALPGLMLMTPEFDQIYALLAASTLYLGLRGLLSQSVRASALWALGAGALISLGLFFSWAFGVMIALLGAIMLVGLFGSRKLLFIGELGAPNLSIKQAAVWATGLAAGVVLPLLMTVLTTQLDLWYVFTYNFANTARAEGKRPYLPWLFYGPVEFFQMLGLPLAMVTVFALIVRPWVSAKYTIFKARAKEEAKAPWYARINPYALIFFVIVLGIDVAGRTKAEQGRLLIFLMPLALIAVYFWAGRRQPTGRWFFAQLFTAQMAMCAIIGVRWLVP